MTDDLKNGVLILDYGSQYTLLIARRIREQEVYCEIWPCNDPRVAECVGTSNSAGRGDRAQRRSEFGAH